jgi:hypothetical protein
MKLNWKTIWKEFDSWYNRKDKKCKKCGSHGPNIPDWEDQQGAIKRIVNKHIAKIGVDTSNLSFDHIPNKRK